MANENLKKAGKKFHFTKENAAEMAKKGREKRLKAIATIKPLRDLAREIIKCKPKKEVINQMVEMFPELDSKKISVKTAMLYSQVVKALNGDLFAFREIRDLIGEKPVEKVHLEVNDQSTIKERYLQLREKIKEEQSGEEIEDDNA